MATSKKKSSKKKSSKKTTAVQAMEGALAKAAKKDEQETGEPVPSAPAASKKKASKKKVSKKKAAPKKKAPVKKEPKPKSEAEINRDIEKKIKGTTVLGKLQMLKLNPKNIVIVEGINPRIDLGDLDELMKSIKQNGQKEPISVLKVGKHYELVHGERRLRAILKLGIKEIKAIEEVGKKTPADLVALHLIHNDGKPLAPVEEADAFRRLIKEGWSAKRISHETGKSLRIVKNRLELISAHPDVAEAVKKGKLSVAMGVAIAKKAKGKKRTQKRMVKKATENTEGKKKIAEAVGKANLKTKFEKKEVNLQNRLNKLVSMVNKRRKDKKDHIPARLVDQIPYFSNSKNKEVRAAFVAGGVIAISQVMGEANMKNGSRKKKVTARGKQKKGKKNA